jgi:hypothetical protein
MSFERLKNDYTPIIGNQEFGLTPDHLNQAISHARTQLDDARRELEPSNLFSINQDRRPQYIARIKDIMYFAQSHHDAMTNMPPEEILKSLQTVYDRVKGLESEKKDKFYLLGTVIRENPDIMKYYDLLRMVGWGYALGQEISSMFVIIKNTEGENI